MSKRTQRRAEQRRANRINREQNGAKPPRLAGPETMLAQQAPTGSTETMLAQQAPTGSTETMLAQQAPTGRPETMLAKQAQTGSTETMLAQQAPTGRPETMLAQQAPTGSTETMLAQQAPTGRPETMLAQQAPTGRPETKSPTSEAQIAANRENAKHSTGPTSDIGKATVSQNRTVHGLNYNPETFRVLACEDQARYDALLQALRDEHKPTETTETLLVTSMAQHRWLLDRANRLQETCFDQETAQITDQKLFSLYLRYATTHERAFHKCLNDLLKLRNQKINQQNGFESEKRKSDRHQSFLKLEELNQRVQHTKAYMAEYMAARQIDADEIAKLAQQAA